MTNEQIREETIRMMVGFMKDKLYGDQEISERDLEDTAAIYYDLVKGIEEAVIDEETRKAAIAAGAASASEQIKEEGLIDASNATQVDLMGGAKAIDRSTFS